MFAPHFLDDLRGINIRPDGQAQREIKNLRQHRRCDTDKAQRFPCRMHGLRQRFEMRIDLTLRALRGKGTEIFGRAKSTRHNERIKLFGVCLNKRMDVTSRNTCGFNQHVTGFRHWFTGQMVNHIRLIFVWRKTNHLCSLLSQGQQRNDGFVYLRTIVNTTSAEHDTNLFHHDNPFLQLAEAH